MLLETGHLGGYVQSSNQPQSIYERPTVTSESNNNNHTNNNNNNNNNAIRRNLEEDGFTIGRGTPIQNFYAGQSVFVTGGTGFLGKILIEKLLRSCPDISTIYLLIRGKKDKNVEDRIEELFNDPVYDRLREEEPKFRHKVFAVSGDCSVRGLGLSSTDRERLERDVSIVFHSAATVRFDETINTAMAINVGSTSEMIVLCKRMPRLKAFIHVSTAYANCHQPKIEESFYPHSVKYEDLNALLNGLQDREIEEMTPKILGLWPNTYTFTKALAEDVVREKCEGLSAGIFRPAIVISSAFEPIPGWIDNFYGPTGAVAAVATGALRTMCVDPSLPANVVPVDLTVNALIASAWDVANQPERRDENMLIYNYVSTAEAPITWGNYCSINMDYAHEFPLSQTKWQMTLRLEKYKFMDTLGRLFLHYLPALFVDFFRICLGQKPFLMQSYKKIHKFVNVVTWFAIRNWIFTNNNVQNMWERLDAKDKQNFRFSMKYFAWRSYFRDYMKGVKVHLFKEDLSTLEACRKKSKRLRWIHETVQFSVFALVLWLLWTILIAILF